MSTEPTKTTQRRRGPKPTATQVTEATPAYDQHLADLGTIRTLEAQKADLSRAIERMESDRVFQNERIAGLEGQLKDAAALAASRQETLQGRNAEIQKLKEQHDADLRERLALANQRDEARAERDDYKRSVDALTTQLDNALAERNAAQQGAERLQVERDQWKATAERFQTSTNNLGGMLKLQSRVSEDAYPGDALAEDLPGGLLSGINWGRVVVWAACAGIGFLLLQLALLAGKGGRP